VSELIAFVDRHPAGMFWLVVIVLAMIVYTVIEVSDVRARRIEAKARIAEATAATATANARRDTAAQAFQTATKDVTTSA
jgi:hypothetical protein